MHYEACSANRMFVFNQISYQLPSALHGWSTALPVNRAGALTAHSNASNAG
jgi:hypothetical protein